MSQILTLATEPDRKPRRGRKWLRRVAVLLLVLIVTLLAMPLWLPWVLVPVLERNGVQVGGYDRRGLSHLDLFEIGFTNEHVAVRVERGSVQWPLNWVRDRLANGGTNREPQLSIHNWDVRIQSTSADDGTSTSTNSLSSVLGDTIDMIARLRPWVKWVVADSGSMQVDEQPFRIDQVRVTDRFMQLDGHIVSLDQGVALEADYSEATNLKLHAESPDLELAVDVELRNGWEDWRIVGSTTWQENTADVSGRIGPQVWLPEMLTVTATNWTVPAALIGLEGYEALSGSAQVGWTNAQYEFALEGEALPDIESALLPDRIHFDVQGQGGLESLVVETLDISTPSLQALLESPLAMDFEGRLLVPETTLRVSANLTPADELPFTGVMFGNVRARPGEAGLVSADFDVEFSQFDGFGLSLDRVDLAGALNWPNLILSNGSFTLPEGGTFEISSGELDLVSRMASNVEWSFDGAIPSDLLPDGLQLNRATMSGGIQGAWPDLAYEMTGVLSETGWLDYRLDVLQMEASGGLRGTNQVSATASVGSAEMGFDGSVDLSGLSTNRVTAVFRSLRLQPNTETEMTLANPFTVSADWSAGQEEGGTGRFDLDIEPFALVDEGSAISGRAELSWPRAGELFLSVSNLTTEALSELPLGRLPQLVMERAEMSASWNGGAVMFTAESVGDVELVEGNHAQWRIEASGGENGVRFLPSQLLYNARPVIAVEGHIPAVLSVASGAPELGWIESGAFEMELESIGGEEVWLELENRTGIRVLDPELQLRASGDFENFDGLLTVNAGTVQWVQYTNLPAVLTTISNLTLRATASHDDVAIRDGAFEFAGQPAVIEASVQLNADNWGDAIARVRELTWRDISGSFRLPKLEVAALGAALEGQLRPVGSATVDVTLEPGGVVNGSVGLNGLATRTIEPLGSIREISGRILFDQQRATLEGFGARVGGETAQARGQVAWNENGLGAVDVSLTATNVTLVRTIDLFLRGDLDVRVQSDGQSPPMVAGEVRLHNSLLFQDIGNLLRANLDQPESRPPFFSFDQPPFADWGLDIRVRGQEFLRVLSPVFRGYVSTGLQLGGTLGVPVAVGEVSVESGRILFPFGSLSISYGAVQLTEAEPHRPKVDFRGQGMNFGYSVSMDVSGTADAPNINFNSSPPLTTREIMLMLTAGEIPSGDFAYDEVDKASKLGYFLGKELIDELLGLDTSEERLVFKTGEYVTDDGQLTYRVEYRMIDWLSIFGEYTRFREYNGGLKFNVYSR